ncbi:type II toxin-antitoxin system VapB family antitoxin [Sphingomonas sp. BIUV-7]|uniref:Type II toxin-antitoxin system VapB family antitoxin n=1 Tax=Sphingomonas natans TaxID=3063330 RepID=A0ABT8Y3B0_9SPHN|nr:type II toxin-antitoxin system VapB family antitoxin [Sphingomonas sp. BIUV-7]MDO6412792.1 type II toxin-antitoxin system VapB family antitoxin [Sphingomonas sp. BIUV-7]
MASLYIKDSVTAARVGRVAERLGTTKTDTIRRALDALEAELSSSEPRKAENSLIDRLDAWRAAHPLPSPTGHQADKAFFDWLSGEEDVEDLR